MFMPASTPLVVSTPIFPAVHAVQQKISRYRGSQSHLMQRISGTITLFVTPSTQQLQHWILVLLVHSDSVSYFTSLRHTKASEVCAGFSQCPGFQA